MDRARRIGWVLAGLALVLRLGWIGVRGAHADTEFDDEKLHWQLATNLVQRGELVSDDGLYAARMPLYPLFLATFAGRGPIGIQAARAAQALLGALTVLIVYRLALAALGPRPALAAGLLACCDPFAVFFSHLLLTEVLFTLLAVGLVACTWRLIAGGGSARRSPAALAGVALLGAAAVLTRPAALGWVLLTWLVLWLAAPDRRRGAGRIAACAAVLAAAWLPWGLRNRAVLGAPAWLSTNGGLTLYDAQGPQADGSSDQKFLSAMPELKRLNEVERDRRLKSLAWQQMRKDPARVLRLAVAKLGRTWSPVPNVGKYSGGATGLASAAYTLAVLVLAGVGVAGVWRRGTARGSAPGWAGECRYHLLLWLPVLYFTLVHCVYIGSLRYRVPLMPLLALAAASAFVPAAGPAGGQPEGPARGAA